MIPLLAPLFQGEWTSYGETLACAPHWPPEAIPVSSLSSDDTVLGDAIRHYAAHLGVTNKDLRATASAWSLEYLWALLPPVAAAASVLQHGFPVRADEVAVSLNETGAPVRIHIRHEGRPLPGTPTATRYDTLLDAHLEPLFNALGRHTRIATKILWANAARYLEVVIDHALALTGNAPAIAADREALLQHATRPDGRPNPLYARQRTSVRIEDGKTVPITLYRQCCLFYRLPGQDYCGSCPLSPEHRQATRQRDESAPR